MLLTSKSQAQFQTMEIRTSTMSVYVRPLTPNTFILVVISDPHIQSAIPINNIQAARSHFEKIELEK